MAKQVVNIGTGPNTNTGDRVRDAFIKVNSNFTELYSRPVITDLNQLTDAQGLLFSGDWEDLTGKPNFATVATTGSFYDLIDYPEIANFNISFFVEGKPVHGETVFRYVVPQAINIAASFSGSIAKSEVAATASTVFTINRNGSSIGTFTFATSGTSATFSGSAVSLSIGDVISVVAPVTQDTTLANIAVTIKALRG